MSPWASSAFALGTGLLALAVAAWGPGWLLARRLGLGRAGLERFAIAWSLGRLFFSLAAWISISTVGPVGVWGYAGACAAALVVAWRNEGPSGEAASQGQARWPLLLAAAAGLLLVFAVVGSSGVPDGRGGLVFQGRDAVNDPLVYTAIATRLYETGWPLHYPLGAGATTTSTYLPYGVFVGLHALGVPMLDAVLRVVPAAEATALGLAAVALALRLAAGSLAAGLAGLLVALGAGLSGWAVFAARLLGAGAVPIASWAFFGPYLLAFNPLAPALQTSFAVLLLLAALPAAAGARAVPVVAGVLVASLFETKLFVFAPVFVALAAVAFVFPPAGMARALRTAFGVAAVVVLPFLAEKLFWAAQLRGRETTAFLPCPGCLPRYLIDGSFFSGDLGFARFETFAWSAWLAPGEIAAAAAASIAMLVLGLGLRLAAAPVLARGARSGEPSAAALHRVAGLAIVAALGASLLVTTRPHYLNGAQFATTAGVLAWPFAAVALAAFVARRRWLGALLLAAALAPGAALPLVDLGLSARPLRVVSEDRLALARAVGERTAPGDVLVEPSLLADEDFPSALTWYGGRSSYLTLLSAAKILPEAELLARHERIATIFTSRDRRTALAALAETGAGWVVETRAHPLRFDPGPALALELELPGGRLYRVVAPRP